MAALFGVVAGSLIFLALVEIGSRRSEPGSVFGQPGFRPVAWTVAATAVVLVVVAVMLRLV